MSKDDDFPQRANCVTFVRHLLKEVAQVHLPHGWVGDLPHLLTLRDWRILRVRKLRPGDLVFRGNQVGSLSHIAIAIDSQSVFHCAWKRNVVIESVDQFFKLNLNGIQSPLVFKKIRDSRS